MNDVHEHPLGYGFLSNNDHKDLFKTLSDAVELPTDVTQANLMKPQRDAAATMAAGLGQMIAVASVQHPLAGALTVNADALVKQINDYESGDDALYKFEEDRLTKLVDAEKTKEAESLEI